ncbi:hypothetical protein GCM10022258_03770 [Aquimarina gracilis]
MIFRLLFFEGGDYSIIVYFLLLILLGPPALLSGIGIILFRKSFRRAGKILFIIAGIYLIVGLGICGALLGGF